MHRDPPPASGDAAAGGRLTHVFFDAEGTLWMPHPGMDFDAFWAEPRPERAAEVFRPTPRIHGTLEALRASGLRLVVMSKHDVHVLPRLLERFGMDHYFDDVLVNGHKGARVLQWLHAHDLRRENALMVGDRVDLDIEPLESFGIRAVLLDRPYNQGADAVRIHDLRDLVGLVAFVNRDVRPTDPAHAGAKGASTWTGLAPTPQETSRTSSA